MEFELEYIQFIEEACIELNKIYEDYNDAVICHKLYTEAGIMKEDTANTSRLQAIKTWISKVISGFIGFVEKAYNTVVEKIKKHNIFKKKTIDDLKDKVENADSVKTDGEGPVAKRIASASTEKIKNLVNKLTADDMMTVLPLLREIDKVQVKTIDIEEVYKYIDSISKSVIPSSIENIKNTLATLYKENNFNTEAVNKSLEMLSKAISDTMEKINTQKFFYIDQNLIASIKKASTNDFKKTLDEYKNELQRIGEFVSAMSNANMSQATAMTVYRNIVPKLGTYITKAFGLVSKLEMELSDLRHNIVIIVLKEVIKKFDI